MEKPENTQFSTCEIAGTWTADVKLRKGCGESESRERLRYRGKKRPNPRQVAAGSKYVYRSEPSDRTEPIQGEKLEKSGESGTGRKRKKGWKLSLKSRRTM